jgi:hypothetical protein
VSLCVPAVLRWGRGSLPRTGTAQTPLVPLLRHPEVDVDLFTIQKLLGHGRICTTGRYLHLISPQFRASKDMDPLDLFVSAD